MPPRNSLRSDNNIQDPIDGDEIINSTVRRVVRITDGNGNVRDLVVGGHTSALGENGEYADTELIGIQTDRAGNLLPEDPHALTLSHSGLFIKNNDQRTSCTSWFHGHNTSRNILIGQDGRLIEGGAICSNCDALLNSIYIALGIIACGIVIGVYKGAGFF